MRGLMIAISALALAGCVSTNATMLGTSSAAVAVDPATVAIYRTAAQVPGPYTEVALLNSTGDSNMTNESTMFASMKKRAAALGANAIILDSVTEPGSGAKVAAAIFGVSAQRKGRAVAIRLTPAN